MLSLHVDLGISAWLDLGLTVPKNPPSVKDDVFCHVLKAHHSNGWEKAKFKSADTPKGTTYSIIGVKKHNRAERLRKHPWLQKFKRGLCLQWGSGMIS